MAKKTMHLALPHVASLVYNTPLMITEAKLQTIMSFLTPRLQGGDLITAAQMREDQDVVVPDSLPEPEPEGKTLRVVPVEGVLMNKVRGMDAFSGMTSYGDIVSAVREATDDPDVVATVLMFSSPGGGVPGAFDAADALRQMDSVKPIYAIVDEEANSAAYLLASTASKIYVTRTSIVGSIGVRTQHIDVSEFNAKMGIKYTDLYSGEHKVDGSQNKPLPDDVKADIQKELDSLRALFADTVADNRSLTVSEVLDTEAAIYAGEAAISAGLADAVLSVDQAFDDIIQITANRSNASMRTQATPITGGNVSASATGGAPVSDTVLETPSAEPTITVAQAEANAQEAADAKVKEERKRIAEIYALPEAVGKEAMCAKFIDMGLSVDDAKELLAVAPSAAPVPEATTSPLETAMEGIENPVVGADTGAVQEDVDDVEALSKQILANANVYGINTAK